MPSKRAGHIDGPPQDLQAEQVALGAMLVDAEAVPRVLGRCVETDFVPEVHRLVYRAIRALVARQEPVDIITVAGELRRMGVLERAGGAAYLSSLISEVPTSAHAPMYAARVAELGALRELGSAGYAIWSDTREAEVTFVQALERAEERIREVRGRIGVGALTVTAEELLKMVRQTQWLWQSWLPLGYLSVLAGDKGKGKSALVLWLAAATTGQVPWPTGEWAQEGRPVLWVDTEARQDQLLGRIEQWGLDASNIHLPKRGEGEGLRMDTAEGRHQLRELARTIRPGLVVIDSLSGGHQMDENSALMRVFLKGLAEEIAYPFQCSVLAVHHFRKPAVVPGVHTQAREATAADLRGSNVVEQFAVSLLLLDRPDGETDVQRLRVEVSNLCAPPEPLGFAMDERGVPEFPEAPQPERAISLTEKARTFLREYLSRGAVPVVQVEQAAYQHGHGLTRRALRNALAPARDWPGIVTRVERGIEYWGLMEDLR